MQAASHHNDPGLREHDYGSVDDNYTPDSIKLSPSNSLPYRECPRFNTCSVNNCPLHPGYPALYNDLGDHERKCTMEKQVRDRIGSRYPDLLKFRGLTRSEWSGRERYDAMPTEDKRRLVERGLRGLIKAKSSAFQRQRTPGIHNPSEPPINCNPAKTVEPQFTRTLIRSVEEYELEARP